MEYKNQTPVTKPRREVRRDKARRQTEQDRESNRQRSKKGGQPDELGVTQGQNGEQGNTYHPRNARPIGKTET